MIDLLVEIKKEYIEHLSNIIIPLIFQGFVSIYNNSKNYIGAQNKEDHLILVVFQYHLKNIKKWQPDIIDKESKRIINEANVNDLKKILKAIVKASVTVLLYNPVLSEQKKISKTLYDIKFKDFIYKIYLECSMHFINNSYLFYHLFPKLEILRNNIEINNIIKKSIEECIRKLIN
jgi:hypothetical protein